MPLPALIEAMLDPSFYPRRPRSVELRQTHISFVLLAGDDVYKLKKPVCFTFLDFSSLERRRFFCHEEVRLNRRLAADVYRGVVGLRRRGDTFELTAEDDPDAIEYAVHMRRLDDDRTLAHQLEHGTVAAEIVDRLAALLVEFHQCAEAGEDVRALGDTAAILRVLEDNFEGVRPFRGITLAVEDDDAIQRFARAFLEREVELFRRRQRQGRIREGHGDLRSDHIYLGEPPLVVDCVEFSPRFRCCDVASDLAFLAMDLEMRGRPDLGARLVARYAVLAADAELTRLVPFYSCYRAYVRGKVGSLTSAEEEVAPEERRRAADGARLYFSLAYRLTWAYERGLIAVAGLSGSGKSTVARRLAERTGFALFSTDVIRKQLAGLPPTARVEGAPLRRLYSAEMSRRTYAEMLARADETLKAGRGAIIDGTFQVRAGREEARDLATARGAGFLLVDCRCPDEVIRHRLAERARRNDDPSDADWAVVREQQRRTEPIAAEEKALVVDTSGEVDDVVRQIEAAARRP